MKINCIVQLIKTYNVRLVNIFQIVIYKNYIRIYWNVFSNYMLHNSFMCIILFYWIVELFFSSPNKSVCIQYL